MDRFKYDILRYKLENFRVIKWIFKRTYRGVRINYLT